MKKGLIMEGGAMRGMFTAGVIDTLLYEEIEFDGAIGVSAGATFGCNIKSRQMGRVLRYSLRYCRDPRYSSIASLLLTGNLYNVDFDYHRIPEELDLWDKEAFVNNPMEFYVTATDAETGEALYHKMETGTGEDIAWIQGSASLPLAAKPVHVKDHVLLDGGISDSVPYRYFESIGYDRNVIVLTQPIDYVKKPYSNAIIKGVEKTLKEYPVIKERLMDRHDRYNAEIADIVEQEKQGNVFVIRPPHELDISALCHKPQEIRRVYDIGVKAARECMPQLKEFLNIR